MLLALYFFIMNVALPQIGAYAEALINPVMTIVITFAGIVMIFGAVGIKISNNLGSTIINGIFRGIGYLFQSLFRAIAWIVRSTFRLLPRVFAESRRIFGKFGLKPFLCNIFAVLVTALVFIVIV